jgi:hypothetical protein
MQLRVANASKFGEAAYWVIHQAPYKVATRLPFLLASFGRKISVVTKRR